MGNISFRQATQADLTGIFNYPLSREELFYFFPSANHPLTLAQLEQQLNERHQSTVILEDNHVAGFANFYNVENRNIAFIGNVIIKPEKRQRGLGKKLLQMMITTGFSQLRLKEIHLSCYNNNTPALLFYNSLGFKPYAAEARTDFNNKAVVLIHLRMKAKLEAS